ncbi:MAG: DUF1036 domain-containing protein [Hyphomonadaceae bacterium]|nr:DUF1036 domain-containing protein [Hyphomonadaceae bacterium]
MLRFVSAAFLGLALLTSPASAQKEGIAPATNASTLSIEICNSSGRNVFAALVYRDSAGWHSAGWYRIDNGQCDTPVVSDNLIFYAFAEEVGNTDYTWGGDFPHCITRPGPYDFMIDPVNTVCGKDQELVDFAQWEAESFGTFTWTLDP